NQVGNLVFSNEQSNLQDGQFQVYILTDESTGSKLSALKDILFGKLEDNDSIKSFACSKLTTTNSDDNETQVDIDGNDGPYLPCEIELLPKHINFYVP
ncbi:diacylglycerol kinase family lipid kinase, partial [Streptococcus anginosus]|nr:diacylglycerol kinase family lipid kinase [Streptococcus anginosus]